jgi:hypothetical protein
MRAKFTAAVPILSLALAGALLVSAGPALARQHRRSVQDFLPNASSYRWITVNSAFGNTPSTISAPVRQGPMGMQVWLPPRGPWRDCGSNCFNTLRTQTVDFWNRLDD